VPTILSAEGYSIVKSFRYSVVIYAAVIPGYVLGGHVVEWLDRKYAILFSFVAMGLCGTRFGLSRTPREIMLFGGLTVFFLALGSTAIYTYTPELYPTELFVRPVWELLRLGVVPRPLRCSSASDIFLP
jgi:putative MFS transporter